MVEEEIKSGYMGKGEGFEEEEECPTVRTSGCLVKTDEKGVMVLVWRNRPMVRERGKETMVKEKV